MKIEKLKAVLDALQKRINEAKKASDTSAITGFTANYALYVHENLEMRLKGLPRPTHGGASRGYYWDPQGQAGPKFLEGPARELKDEVAKIVSEALKNGATLAQALVMGCLRIQREAMQRCPVDTGFLKASAFTRLEEK